MKNPFKNLHELPVSDAIKRLNPTLFSGAMGAQKPQPKAQRPLEQKPQGRQQSPASPGRSTPRYRVALVALRRRKLDRDNLIGGCKPLRDAIAQFLGVDDNERFVEWEYDQAETRGIEETLVRIEIL